MIIHFYVIPKTQIAVFLCENTISSMLVCQAGPAGLGSNQRGLADNLSLFSQHE